MPLYEYKCERCGGTFSDLRRTAEREHPIACPDCGGSGKIIFSTFAQGAQPDSCSKRDRCSSGST